MHCQHAQICSGCPWIGQDFQRQSENKKQSFLEAWKAAGFPQSFDFQFEVIAEGGFRDRADLVVESGRLGLYEKNSRRVFDMQSCPQMAPELDLWFQEFKRQSIPVKKGSLRLRVSPQGKKGLWLDFANQDIKDLFEEEKLLRHFLDIALVEIGQKRKALYYDGERLRLSKDPRFETWTQTTAGGKKIPLYSLIGTFSQAGDKANQVITAIISQFAARAGSLEWIEFGSGNGNLTFPLSDKKRSVVACEFDELAAAGLHKTLMSQPEFSSFIKIKTGDFQKKEQARFQDFTGILVNPPRSGLMNFLEPLSPLDKSQRPKDFIYMSCFMESFLTDSKKLHALGYQAKEITLVDQFPQSPHFEILTRWSL